MQANPIRRIGSWAEMSESIIAFTQHEGFPAHEAAVRIRLEDAR
jgi:histidinol dehydrogenase